jgi:hypothetical protein
MGFHWIAGGYLVRIVYYICPLLFCGSRLCLGIQSFQYNVTNRFLDLGSVNLDFKSIANEEISRPGWLWFPCSPESGDESQGGTWLFRFLILVGWYILGSGIRISSRSSEILPFDTPMPPTSDPNAQVQSGTSSPSSERVKRTRNRIPQSCQACRKRKLKVQALMSRYLISSATVNTQLARTALNVAMKNRVST